MDDFTVKKKIPPDFKPPVADISWVKRKYLDVPYGNLCKAQCLDIYLPEEGSGPFPVLIHIHGGGFAMGDKRDDHINAYLDGIRRGFALISLGYRLSGEAVFPAAVLDCREAIRFIKRNAANYHLDAGKLAVIGGSAGGNLAAMLAMNIPNGEFTCEEKEAAYEETPFVNVVIEQFGPMNFKTMDEEAGKNKISYADHDDPSSPESEYLGIAVPDAPPELCNKANPAAYASEKMCPVLVEHGTADRLVPYEQSVEFVREVREKAGDGKVRFVSLAGAAHDDKIFTSKENMNLIFEFINEKLLNFQAV